MRKVKVDIEGKTTADPGNCSLMEEMQEVNDNIANTKIKLKNEVEMKLTDLMR